MAQDYLPPPGEPVEIASLTVHRAREVARVLASAVNPYARFVECRRDAGVEVVVLDVDVEVPQHRTHDIRPRERLAVRFDPNDEQFPEVLALRPDFPVVPHLNIRSSEMPRSLCLYDRPYNEVKPDWTAPRFVERIRSWLADTARGRLHGEDQPLEPLLLAAAPDLIVPARLLEESQQGVVPMRLQAIKSTATRYVYVAESLPGLPSGPGESKPLIAFTVSGTPQVHGVIRKVPTNLAELHGFMSEGGCDLLSLLRRRVREWNQASDTFGEIRDNRLAVIAQLPKTREVGGPVETVELRAFIVVSHTIAQLGEAIGLWSVADGQIGHLLSVDETKRGEDVQLLMANPRLALSRSLAASVSASGGVNSARIAAIGVGALGSQVISNLVRTGFGQWTMIDDDVILPHNLARHALYGFAVGFAKADALSHIANTTIDGDDIAQALVADVLQPGEEADRVRTAFEEAQVILDMSASVAVARHIALDVDSPARRVSLFMSPSGKGLTLLAEDAGRTIPLDALEMQLYRELVENATLVGFLKHGPGLVRAGQSCRDVTARISQDMVALQAAIGSRAFHEALSSDEAKLRVWQADHEMMTVRAFLGAPRPVRKVSIGDWTVCTDEAFVERVSVLREAALPNETGGILVGAFDLARKIVYVVDCMSSPDDSETWPTVYIRGSEGLRDAIRKVEETTDGMLGYVGEWHSHPDGYGVSPSSDDLNVLKWEGLYMASEGLPATVAIAGQRGEANFLIAPPLVKSDEERPVLEGSVKLG